MARNGQFDEARRWFDSVLRIKPDHVPTLKAPAELRYKMFAPKP